MHKNTKQFASACRPANVRSVSRGRGLLSEAPSEFQSGVWVRGGGGREFYFVGVKLSVVLGCWRQGAGEPVMHLTRQDCSTLNPKQLTWSRPGTVGSVDALLAETCNPVPVTPLTCFSASGSRGRSLQSTGRPQAQLLRVSLSSWELQQLQ